MACHMTHREENVLTLGGKTMEVHTADDTGDRKVKKEMKKIELLQN